MEVKLLFLTVVLLSSPLLTLCDPLFVLSAPNLLRVGSSENLFVEAQDYSGGNMNVKIIVKNHPKKSREILSQSVTLTSENNFQILTDIKIPDNQSYFSDDPLEKQYVYLQAQFPSVTLEKVDLLSFQSGYIFVQTDKPIYTPASTVLYRIFSLMPNLKPLNESKITVEIKNPQGITVSSENITTAKGIQSGKYAIPDVASSGIWKVVTLFSKTPQKKFTADFEVREYVLPTCEVKLKPRKSFFYVGDESLTVDIEAKYLFGQEVDGNAFVVFGVMEDEKKTSISASLQKVQIVEGEGTAELTNQMITDTFPNINQLVGRSIYVSVSLLTESGSEMVEAERRGIQIVTSPYTIHFKKTPHFFKPGMPFDVSVYVTNPDQTPAVNVEVEVNPGGFRGRTRDNGIAKVTVNTQRGSSTLDITAKTKDPEIEDNQQAVKKMTAQAYKTKGGSNNYLYISIDAAVLQIVESMTVCLSTGQSPGVRDQDFTYMILSKGQIVKADRFKRRGQSIVTLPVSVTKDMVPSFRFVAYYHVGSSEVVSDSVWVDVKDTCMGKEKEKEKEKMNIYGTGEEVKLQITGDPEAKVGLVVVDKAVQVLNKKRLTQTQVKDLFQMLWHNHLVTVFHKTYIIVFTLLSENSQAPGGVPRGGFSSCSPIPSLFYTNIVFSAGNYSGELKQCCVDGMRDNKLGYTCERRATYIMDGEECVKAFLDCCNQRKTRKNTKTEEEEQILARSDDDDDDDDDYQTDSEEIVSRTQFPESWLWEVVDLPTSNKGETTSITKPIFLKDSITTWQILAVSLSPTLGICVAEPVEMVVFKHLFIDLKMPYSAFPLDIEAVRVEFMETEDVCSSASKKGKYRTTVSVDKGSSIAVSYVIIPMTLGSHMIEVNASAYGLSDGVRKPLKVVSEGVLIPLQRENVELNPVKNGEKPLVFKSVIPTGRLPDTPADTYISITGKEKGDFINVKGLHNNKQINIFSLSFLHRPSSTWLTAYVAKVFAMASDLIPIEDKVLCNALEWLVLHRQVQDGSFKEDSAVIHGEMVGDVQGKDADASLTAFVVIAMQEAREICAESVASLNESIRKAVSFLEGQLPQLTNPYAVALTSYAMANANKLNKDILMKHSSQLEAGRSWTVPGQHHHSLEATAYAVLALVKDKDFDKAGEAVHWLNRQQSHYGGSGTTQATIMVFQAVAEYRTQVKDRQNFNLNVELSVAGRSKPVRWAFKRDNMHLTRSDKVDINQEFNVTAKGTGTATLSVLTLYYARPVEKKSDCTFFDLTVKMEKDNEGAVASYKLTMDFYYKDDKTDATMTILDIGLPTGFEVEESDLKELSSGKERYIQKYENNKVLSERGSLILYLDKVSHRETERIVFRMHQMHNVGQLQPAAVTIYEYYSPDARCTKFYHPERTDGAIYRLCKGDLCQCAEENCTFQRKNKTREEERLNKACEGGMDYVYKATVVGMDLKQDSDIYDMKVEQVLKEGTDDNVEGNVRQFLARPGCREYLGLVEGKSYLIMGRSVDLPKLGGR
uniref:Complement C3-like n=1 Tax=Sinocyclocheilus grahami TaxID=75366 RepID=A0A672KBF5_SINGR